MDTKLPEWVESNLHYLQDVMMAVVIFAAGWLASKWAGAIVLRICTNRKLDESVGRFLAGMAVYAVLAAAVISSLGTVGVQTTSLVAVFASAGLAVGLALQGNLSNFASGVLILIFRPLRIGEKVKINDVVGDVSHIGLFTTTMMTFENEMVIVPNSQVTGGMIVNYTQPGKLRAGIDVGIAYGSDVAHAMEVMLEAAREAEHVLQDPAPHIAFVGLGASSLDFTVYVWCASADYRAACHAVRTAVYDALCRADIEIPFTQLVLHNAD